MVDVIVAGAAGRMGTRIINVISQTDGVKLTGAFEHPDSPSVGQDAGVAAGIGAIGIKIANSINDVIAKGDVIIDFTSPKATLENIKASSSKGLSMVIGTTGMTGELLEEVENIARGMRCVISPNMSVGVNVMLRVAAIMAEMLGDDYDLEVLEAHHNLKKDAPSGTAMAIARTLAKATGRDLDKVAVYERKGITGERTKGEIGIQTLRAGDITGDHTIMFGGIGERLELIHRAHNRDNLARGAVRAAKWVVEQPAGLYNMQDVLGI
jgi:4-hydroxy-tetrahydrodipicolinate reductase